jgi:hypothetical protein
MYFKNCLVKAVRADMVKGSATIVLEMRLTEDVMAQRERLSWISANENFVDATITETQPHLFTVNEPVGMAQG